jgi:hypothetical protein
VTDIRYRAEQLRRGADAHRAVSSACDALSARLAGVVVEPGAFGDVPSAARLARSTVAAREVQAHDAAAEALRRADLADRASTAAALGEMLTTLTTATARAGAPVPAVPGLVGEVVADGPGD